MLYTKQNFLKKIATLFDPIGFLAPFIIRAKMLLQDMWTAGLKWDDELTEPLASCARAWFGELEKLKKVRIPRCLQRKDRSLDGMSLHTFVDASENAYGAIVYARCTYEDGSSSSEIVSCEISRCTLHRNKYPSTGVNGCCYWCETCLKNIRSFGDKNK